MTYKAIQENLVKKKKIRRVKERRGFLQYPNENAEERGVK